MKKNKKFGKKLQKKVFKISGTKYFESWDTLDKNFAYPYPYPYFLEHCLGITFIGAVFIYIFHQTVKTELNFVIRRETGVKYNSENLTEYFTKKNGEIFYVVYNRVPKCGSGGTSNLLEQLSNTNNFESVFHYDKTDKHQLTVDVTRALTSEFQNYESRKFG